MDLLIDIEENTSANTRQINILIQLEYFKKFGNNKKLLTLYEEFTKGKNKYDKKHKETAKLKRIEVLKQIESELPNDKIPLKDQMTFENEILGYVQATCDVDKRYVYVMDVNTKFSPRIEAYCLNNGKTESMKIAKKVFDNKPVSKDDIIYINKVKAKPQKKFIDGKFVDVEGTKEWWIEEYDIRTNEF